MVGRLIGGESVRDINAPSRKVLPLQAAPGLVDGWLRPRIQGYDLQLTRHDARGWRATFYTTEMEHFPVSATGSAWERTPWHATQRAAWEALRKVDAAPTP